MFLKQFKERNERLILTLISKQWLVFFIGTALLIFKYVTAEVWVFLASFCIGAGIFQKVTGTTNGNPNNSK